MIIRITARLPIKTETVVLSRSFISFNPYLKFFLILDLCRMLHSTNNTANLIWFI